MRQRVVGGMTTCREIPRFRKGGAFVCGQSTTETWAYQHQRRSARHDRGVCSHIRMRCIRGDVDWVRKKDDVEVAGVAAPKRPN
jgi:hypothetical protein